MLPKRTLERPVICLIRLIADTFFRRIEVADVKNYQARLDILGLKDHQLRQPVTVGQTFRRIVLRSVTLLAIAVPGAILHVPIGWIAAAVGERFSYEMDDVTTLKVVSTILLLPLVYLVVSVTVGMQFGFWWGIALFVGLPFSFLASVRLVEAEMSLLMSMLSLLRLARVDHELKHCAIREQTS